MHHDPVNTISRMAGKKGPKGPPWSTAEANSQDDIGSASSLNPGYIMGVTPLNKNI